MANEIKKNLSTLVNINDQASAEVENDREVDFWTMVGTLPKAIRSYLFSSKTDQTRIRIFDDLNLTQEDRDTALFTELEVLFGDLDLSDYPNALWSRLPWAESEKDRAKHLIVETVGQIFLPIASYMGDVVGLLSKLKVDPKKYAGHEIEVRSVSFKDGAVEIAAATQLEGLDNAAKQRLINIIESRLREVRDDLDTRTMLTRSKKVGGLELSDAQAGQVIEVLTNEMRLTHYIEAVTEQASKTEEIRSEKKFSSEEIRSRLLGPVEDQKQLAKRIEQIERDTNSQIDLLREKVYELVFLPATTEVDAWDVVAALFALTRHNGLLSSLSDDDRFRTGLLFFFEGRPDSSISEIIKRSPAGREAMNVFLQVVLRGAAQLSAEDSARYGLRLIGLLKKSGYAQYADLVAFDLDKETFIWTELIEM
jgi:hypothetical protein